MKLVQLTARPGPLIILPLGRTGTNPRELLILCTAWRRTASPRQGVCVGADAGLAGDVAGVVESE